MSVISSIGLDHLEWLPKNDRNVDRVIFEKTSKLLHSKIIVSEQSDQIILDKIEKAIASNPSKKILFNNEDSLKYLKKYYGKSDLKDITNLVKTSGIPKEVKNYTVGEEGSIQIKYKR